MRSSNYQYELIRLLKKFNETLIVTIDQVEIGYEFLFEGRKYLPFQGQPELTDILNYLKDNMAVNKLYTFQDLLAHYEACDKEFDEFIDELTVPSAGNIWVSQSETACIKFQVPGYRFDAVPAALPGIQGVIMACLPIKFQPMRYDGERFVENLDILNEQAYEVRGDGEEENCMCGS